MTQLVPLESIEKRIYLVRGQKVMLDSDLAELYEVETKNLNKAVKRNPSRFPEDFMFQLTRDEYESLRFHFGTINNDPDGKSEPSKPGRGQHRKYLPYVFTEQGVAMLSSVLRSERAAQVNVQIMRAFIKLREMVVSRKDLARKLNELEKKYDHQFAVVFDAIRRLMDPPARETKKIGFRLKGETKRMKDELGRHKTRGKKAAGSRKPGKKGLKR